MALWEWVKIRVRFIFHGLEGQLGLVVSNSSKISPEEQKQIDSVIIRIKKGKFANVDGPSVQEEDKELMYHRLLTKIKEKNIKSNKDLSNTVVDNSKQSSHEYSKSVDRPDYESKQITAASSKYFA